MQPAREVELHQAYLWTCDDCGRDQFERAVVLTREALSPEDQEAMDILLGGADSVHALAAPQEVTCKDCGAKFRVAYGEEEDEEEQKHE